VLRPSHPTTMSPLPSGMMWRFEQVAGPFAFTEGPVWDGEAVLFTDIPSNRIMRYDPATNGCGELHANTEGMNGLVLDRQRRINGCQSRGRRVVRYEAEGGTSVLAEFFEGNRLNSPNDLTVDSQGRIWFTDPRYGKKRDDMELDHESVFRLDPRPEGSYRLTRVTFDTTRPNGLVFSPDEKTLYVAESPQAPRGKRQLRAYPIGEGGGLGPARVLHDFGPHRGIDGMTVDTEGNVVAACGWRRSWWRRSGPGPRIAVFAPSGAVLEEHPVAGLPTNVCFGAPDLSDLYVTGYIRGIGGFLWRAKTHRCGVSWP
jgi:gluconolactonase